MAEKRKSLSEKSIHWPPHHKPLEDDPMQHSAIVPAQRSPAKPKRYLRASRCGSFRIRTLWRDLVMRTRVSRTS
jgi:hypothetical protein